MRWGLLCESAHTVASGTGFPEGPLVTWRAEKAVFGLGRIHHLSSPRQRQKLLSAAFGLGIRAFDVAPAYGNGLAERELGRALRGRRDGVEIVTKVGIPIRIYPAVSGRMFPIFRALDMLGGVHARCYQRRDFSNAHIQASVEASLQRLRTDRIDTLYLHEPLTPFAVEEAERIVSCLEELQRQGKILRFGVAGPLETWGGPAGMPPSAILQCPLAAASSSTAGQALSGRDVTFYGAYTHFLKSRSQQSFGGFVDEVLADLPRARVIVAARNAARLAALMRK
jgi:hypothetical protein